MRLAVTAASTADAATTTSWAVKGGQPRAGVGSYGCTLRWSSQGLGGKGWQQPLAAPGVMWARRDGQGGQNHQGFVRSGRFIKA